MKHVYSASICSLLMINALATAGTPAALAMAPAAADSGPSFEVSLGYDSNYIFRGEELFESTVWGQIDAEVKLSSNTSLSFVAWYADVPKRDYTELDLHADLNVEAGFATFSVGYCDYIYPRGGLGSDVGSKNEDEAVFSVTKNVAKIDLTALAAYNFDREGTYFELSAGTSIPVCSSFSLDPSIAIGYGSHYFAKDGLTHVLLTLAAPIALSESVTLTPYIAANLPLKALEDLQDSRVFGGVALSFSF